MADALNQFKKKLWKDDYKPEESENKSSPYSTRKILLKPSTTRIKSRVPRHREASPKKYPNKSILNVAANDSHTQEVKTEPVFESDGDNVKVVNPHPTDAQGLPFLNQRPDNMIMRQQTAVSKIRRSVFKLPITDERTQFYDDSEKSTASNNNVQELIASMKPVDTPPTKTSDNNPDASAPIRTSMVSQKKPTSRGHQLVVTPSTNTSDGDSVPPAPIRMSLTSQKKPSGRGHPSKAKLTRDMQKISISKSRREAQQPAKPPAKSFGEAAFTQVSK